MNRRNLIAAALGLPLMRLPAIAAPAIPAWTRGVITVGYGFSVGDTITIAGQPGTFRVTGIHTDPPTLDFERRA